ncbi:hypothetical protein AB1I64_26300, partial [[Clostridium] symbiosum]
LESCGILCNYNGVFEKVKVFKHAAAVFSEGFYAIIKKTLWNGVPFCRSHIEKKKRRGTNGMEDPIVCPAEGTAGHPGRPVQIPDERL